MSLKTKDIVKLIVESNESIAGVYIHTYPNAPKLQERIKFGIAESILMEEALAKKKQNNIPFWDSLMLSYFDKTFFSSKILDVALKHSTKRNKEFISRNAILEGALDFCSHSQLNVAINSEVLFNDMRIGHILMFDFSIPKSENNQLIVEEILNFLNLGDGYLLDSGRSYHFLSNNLYSKDDLIFNLSKVLFVSPIVDKTWVAHQLIDGSCSLRLTRKDNFYPSLIKRIESNLKNDF